MIASELMLAVGVDAGVVSVLASGGPGTARSFIAAEIGAWGDLRYRYQSFVI
jgi:hypothetical protein